MVVLVIGSGGREHALAWAIAQDSRVESLYCAPGNAGSGAVGVNVDVGAEDIDGLLEFALENQVDLTVVGPEAPLCAGIVDRFQEKGLRIFGPSKAAAELEGSKAFAKQFMTRWGIPTAPGEVFDDVMKAAEYIDTVDFPVVVKADGLAAGKGVLIPKDKDEAKQALQSIMVDRAFGDAGNQAVVEERLEGEEASILAVCDGINYRCLTSSQDHKRAFDGDMGPNTGGMGAYAPAPVITESLMSEVEETILIRTLQGMEEEGRHYQGVLYLGLMMTDHGPKVLEYNCRFGDPETQVVLPLYGGEFLKLLEASVDGTMDKLPEEDKEHRAAVGVVLASGGYPGSYETGKMIRGLDTAGDDNTIIFHAGTKTHEGVVVTSGGRVLNVVGLGNSLEEALELAYRGVGAISFDGVFYRRDIAHRALNR